MSLIVAKNLSKFYGGQDVFADISCRVEPGDRIGLVGPNGEGKSTLIRILAGIEEPSSGQVEHRRGIRIGYLPQDPPDLSDQTLWDMMLDAVADLRHMEVELTHVAEQMADGDEVALARFSALQEEFERRGGYTYEARIRSVLNGLGFRPEQYEQPADHLSGGQRTRALLARLLIETPDLLLLDEPTNHLDIQALEWLESWLGEFKGSLIVIAHDRYFLDKVTNRIWELGFGRLETYRGNYSAYLRQREERFRARMKLWEQQQEYIRRTEEFIRRNIAGQRSREAQGRRTRLQRFLETEAIERPREHRHIRVRITPRFASGDIVFQTHNLVVGYDPAAPLLHVPDLTIRRGERVAIVGPNGAGKTTLVRTLIGEVEPLAGAVRRGSGVRIGYISQTHSELDPDATVLEAVLTAKRHMEEEEARTLLGSFLFHGDEVFKRIRELSGGQRTRVVLARLAVQRPNTLILDEPTNHLDIPSQEILQHVLQDFDGTVIFVSHDRYLIQALATRVWAVEEGTVHAVLGTWEDYLHWRVSRHAAAEGDTTSPEKKTHLSEWEKRREARRQRKARERRDARRQEIEERIARLEARLETLGAAIGQAGEAGDMERVRTLGEEYQAVEQRLHALWEEWETLVSET